MVATSYSSTGLLAENYKPSFSEEQLKHFGISRKDIPAICLSGVPITGTAFADSPFGCVCE